LPAEPFLLQHAQQRRTARELTRRVGISSSPTRRRAGCLQSQLLLLFRFL